MSSLSAPPARPLVQRLPDASPARGEVAGLLARSARGILALSLLGLVMSSLLVVVIAAERPSFLAPITRQGYFPAWMVGPLRGLWPGLTSDGNALEWVVSGLIGGMYVLYVIAFTNAARLRARWTIATVGAIHVVFFLAPPLSYTDVFNYINYGRLGVVHHLNPYSTIPVLAPHTDPSFALSNWHHLLSPYGPLFTLFTYALVPLGVAASFWALKLILAIVSLATLALVWKCAQLLGRSPAAAIVFVGCNPIVLIWGLGAEHNDSLMLFFIVLAVYLALRVPRARSLLALPALAAGSGVALVIAVFIKASAAVLLPIFLLASDRRRLLAGDRRRLLAGDRRRFLAGAIMATVVLGALSLVAFGFHVPDLSTQSHLVTAVGIPNLVGLALGEGGETATLHTVFNIVLVLTVAGCTLWTFRRPGDWLTASAVALLVLIVSLSWAAPWYILWVLPFAALSPARHVRSVVVVLGAYFILAFMPAAVTLENALHFRPTATPLGIEHEREIGRLVR